MDSSAPSVTQLLQAWSNGDEQAREQLIPIVYQELKVLARHALRQVPPGQTLQTTALVHEAYLKLIGQNRVPWRDRTHFFWAASFLMRRFLVERARRNFAHKRGRGMFAIPLDSICEISDEKGVELIALDDALSALEEFDPKRCRIVEMRFFGGLTAEEIAEVLGVSPATVNRQWQAARAWLRRELKKGGASEDDRAEEVAVEESGSSASTGA